MECAPSSGAGSTGGHAVKACDMAGQSGEALILFDDALQIVERTGVRWLAAELNRHKGQLLIRQGYSEAAERLYRKALNIAREQEAKLWELRAAVSLARSVITSGSVGSIRPCLELPKVAGLFLRLSWHGIAGTCEHRNQMSISSRSNSDPRLLVLVGNIWVSR